MLLSASAPERRCLQGAVALSVIGREVARLVDQTLAPGTYVVAFNGSSLASGTYVFRLVSGTTNAHRTMALLE